MKKFLGILLAGFIGFLSIFTCPVNLKNSAEPQYFLQNERQNAIVINNNNEYTFYFDSEVNNYTESRYNSLISLNNNSQLYYIVNGNNNFIQYDLNNYITQYFGQFYDDIKILFMSDTNENGFYLTSAEAEDSTNLIQKYKNANIWKLINGHEYIENIVAFKLVNVSLNIDLETLNENLNPYIGNITSLEEPTTAITQIGSIISDTTNWFVNIFIGLSDVFYSDGQLGVWGSVLFLGVAFTLVSMVLKWVISLIRGI